MNYVQSNTKRGPITVATATDMTGKEGYLVTLTNASGVATAALPGAVTDIACYVVTNAITSTLAEIQPLTPDVQVRIVANGTSNLTIGSKVVGFASSKARLASPYTGSGAAFIVGICEENSAADGQYLKIRPLLTYWTA